ncbi:MAG TPA: nucleotidyltransferase family protein [Casimicrobiaceae bacterium]|nr:nucleotidyltransferase family protein [Casimicrobiaceae bacterium]
MDATFRFLVACVRAVFDDSARSTSDNSACSAADWPLLRALARENRVDSLLRHGLRSIGCDTAPPDVLASLATYEQENRARNDASKAMLVAILRALGGRAIACLVFKGLVLARAYPDPGTRFYWDLDLLVSRTQLAAVHEILVELGYRRDALSRREERLHMRYHFAHTYESTRTGPDIDLHWRLFPAGFPIPVDYAGLWERAECVEIDGVVASAFSREDMLVYVALHGAKEEWRRLQMVADVAALLASRPEIDWERCLRIADACRARRKLLLALHLATDLLGAHASPRLVDAIKADPVIAALADDVIRRQQRLTDRATSIFRFSSWRMRSFEHPIDRARYRWRTLTTPRLEHLAMIDLPWLPLAAYVFVRLVHDCVAIPLRNWGRRSMRRVGNRTL